MAVEGKAACSGVSYIYVQNTLRVTFNSPVVGAVPELMGTVLDPPSAVGDLLVDGADGLGIAPAKQTV